MENGFDKILSNKIKEVIENQDIPYNPEHWKMLLNKKDKNKKRAFFLWKVAAFMLVSLIAGGVYKFMNYNSKYENTAKPQLIIESKSDSLKIDSLKGNKNIYITSDYSDSISNSNKNNTPNTITKFKSNSQIAVKSNQNIHKKFNIDSLQIEIEKSIENLILDSKITTDYNVKELKTENYSELNTKKTVIDSLKITKELLATIENEDEIIDNTIKRKNLKIGVDIAPIVNYTSKNENTNTGIAGGISIELPISKKFDISAGVLYSNQKLDLNEPSNYVSDAISYFNSSELINRNATVQGIEIPINIKYNFSLNDKDVFVSVGFSSTSNFTENVESNYVLNRSTQTKTKDALGNSIVKYELYPIEKTVITPNSANEFNFANILNASLGINIPVNNKHQSVIIEPYIKYYINSVTIQKVDVLGAGIHLRYIFTLGKNN